MPTREEVREQFIQMMGESLFSSRRQMYRAAHRPLTFPVYEILWRAWAVFAIAVLFDAVLWFDGSSGGSFLWYPLLAAGLAFSWGTLTFGFRDLALGTLGTAFLSLVVSSAVNSWVIAVDHLSIMIVAGSAFVVWHAEESTKRMAVLNFLKRD